MDLTVPVNDGDHDDGKNGAPVTLIEYGDFECSYCQEAYPIVKEVQKIQGNKLRFVFRHFPMSQSHPSAFRTACAAEAAAKQGKFWKMHDMLFENQDALDDQDLLTYAKILNLNIQKFNKDIVSKEVARHVKNDFTSGVESGVNGTPTFFINGKRFDEPCEVNLLVKAIDEARLSLP